MSKVCTAVTLFIEWMCVQSFLLVLLLALGIIRGPVCNLDQMGKYQVVLVKERKRNAGEGRGKQGTGEKRTREEMRGKERREQERRGEVIIALP